MRRWIATLVLLAGCDKLFGLDEIKIDAAAGDAGTDAKIFLDAPPEGTVCAGGTNGGPLHVCEQAANLMPRTYAGNVDIDTGSDCDRVEPAMGREPELCLLMATDMTIIASATITARGSRPLVLVAMGTLTVQGTVDVSSHAGGITGASANDGSCITGNGEPQGAAENSSGGGAGGSFGNVGGEGGPAPSGQPAEPGTAVDGASLRIVRGGCPGGEGGHDHSGNFGAGGSSGGAVYLMATNKIVINSGAVLANGAAGGGGMNAVATDFPGGGGAGTGGLVMLDSPIIQLSSATVMANGGGGGGGQGDLQQGQTGSEPSASVPSIAAAGGLGGSNGGGAGGAGSAIGGPSGGGPGVNGAGAAGAAGGGGGGAGVIRMFGLMANTGSQIVPPSS